MGCIPGDSPGAVEQAAGLLSSGGVVALPTETVYGLAAHALNTAACQQVFDIKGRPLEDPLICHVLDVAAAQELAHISEPALALIKAFWPGPLTLILPKKPCVPDRITAGLPTVALRSPAHPLMRKVLGACGLPLAAPSANPFGYISPTSAQHVQDQLGERLPLILDGGPCSIGVESTILDLSDPRHPRILRMGPLLPETLAPVLGTQPPIHTQAQRTGALPAPGLLQRHYSPRCPSSLFDQAPPEDSRPHACLYFNKPSPEATRPHRTLAWLTDVHSLEQAAQHLYAQLRALDLQKHQHLYLQKVPGTGLAHTLNERLKRAAHTH